MLISEDKLFQSRVIMIVGNSTDELHRISYLELFII
jgi:hypothetical protein